jgi:hypothetical protein
VDSVRRLAAGLALASVAATIVPAGAGAAAAPITGKFSKGGYTVIALAPGGTAKTAAAKPAFRVTPPAKVVTLHLRDMKGGYAGPVVVGGTARKAIVGLRAGAELGKVKVKDGYAVARAATADLVKTLTARARSGKPIGAGIGGRVRAKASGRNGLGRDFDRDGLPAAFDVDDDGDLVFDNVDLASSTTRRSATTSVQGLATYNARWVMNGGLAVSYLADASGYTRGAAGYTVNQNAAGSFAANGEFEKLRDLLMIHRGAIIMPLLDQPSELDCGGLTYCRPRGTGAFITRQQKFPDDFDGDSDGRGLMTAVPSFAEGQDGLGLAQSADPKALFGLAPNAARAAINANNTTDTYLARPVSDNTIGYPITLRTVYGTLPALQSWGDPARNVTINYPVPQGSEGSENNAYAIQQNANGEYVLRLTIWRPQREAIEGSGEGTGWIDLGGLTYTVVGKTAEQNRRLFKCPGTSYTTSDGNLSVTPGGLLDRALDKAVNRANTLTFSVNLSQCLGSSGINWAPPGPTINLFVAASSAYGDVVEGLGFSFKPVTPGGPSSGDFTGVWWFLNGANQIGWRIRAGNGAPPTSNVGLFSEYKTVTGGTAPEGGWTCQVARAKRDGDMWGCSGATLSPGGSIVGETYFDTPGDEHMPVGMLVCLPSGDTLSCTGTAMTYSPFPQ